MSTTIIEPPHLAADLKTLCLSTIGAQWRLLAEQAARQRQAPADYLAQLVHLEVTGRRERRIQRRIQDARFPMLKTLDAFSFEAQPDLDRNAIPQVFDCRFVANAANVVFVGGVGTGKTHLSIALGMACCQHDYRVRFVTAAELVTLLVEAQQQGRLARKLAQLARFDLVIRRRAWLRSARQGRRRPAVRVHQPALRAPEPGGDDESAVRALVRGLPRPDGGRGGHRPHRAPRDGPADHRRQLQVGGCEAEPGAGIRQEGSPLMPSGRAPRMPNAVDHRASMTRAVGPISMTACSPASRRVATLRPRSAGLTALTPAARTVTGRSCPTAQEHSSARRAQN